MGIRVNHVALEQIPVGVLRSASPKVIMVILVAFPNLPAECQMPISVRIERDEFDGVAGCVPQIRITFVVTKLFEGWRLVCRGIVGHDLADRKSYRASGQAHPTAISSSGLVTRSFHEDNARSFTVRKIACG